MNSAHIANAFTLAAITMKTLLAIIIMTSIWTFFSCKSKKTKKIFKPQTQQDTKNKKVTQIIHGVKTEFDYSDFTDLKHNKYYDRFLAGQLNIPTGQIVCTDPMYRELGLPQSWRVPKGKYPVYLYIGLEDDFAGRVAYAELEVKDEIPTYWELSLIPENLLADTFEKKMNGFYPVENGLSCFADFETYSLYDKEITEYHKADTSNNYYFDKLDKLFKQNRNVPKSSRGEDWLNYIFDGPDRNIIMFGSGYGDGFYPRYVGYDKEGNVVKFITDFIQLKSTNDE
jgi:Protein of unknown function (DUF4241)